MNPAAYFGFAKRRLRLAKRCQAMADEFDDAWREKMKAEAAYHREYAWWYLSRRWPVEDERDAR